MPASINKVNLKLFEDLDNIHSIQNYVLEKAIFKKPNFNQIQLIKVM